MKVVTDSNETIDLGVTETSPTISITDYSRRVTDDFGVTNVVPRKFSRRLSVRMLLATGSVDAVQRRLAGLRATPARWVASDDLAWLAVRGFFKDFEIDVADPLNSFCTLSVEGLAESETVTDSGVEPAPTGASSLRLLQPVAVTGSTLVSSTVAENDYSAWSGTTTYPKGARVILSSTHRIYESAAAGNNGNEPNGTSGAWIDIGPTNRWRMFDEALGTSTTASGSLSVVLTGSAVNAIALVDVTGASVRVQAAGYDRTQTAGAGAIVFADLPNVTGQITVTVSGSGVVAVGTLLIGRIVGLGITEASPTAGITDYSRKDVDDFGEVTVVQRAWAKRMAARALIRTDAVDQVANRIAAVRARPCLWIADSALDSITLYGFFKDFSIEVGERVSKLSLSVEGLSKAAPIATTVPDVGGLSPRGNYDPAAVYSEGDVVQYDGSSWYYIAQDPSSGHAPPLLPTTENTWWRVFAQAGRNGEDAPLVIVQWSVDGMTGWHANYVDGDLYQRQSNDGGLTYGPAVRVVGEGAGAGADGVSPSIIFRRLAAVPATPQQDTGNPPPGWYDAPPPGSDLLWQSVSKFRGSTQLEPWSAPVRITGPAGGSAVTIVPHSATTIVEGNSVRGTASTGWGTDAAHTKESFIRGAIAQWTLPALHGDNIMAGLAQNGDSVSNSFDSITFAIFRQDNGNIDARVNGNVIGVGPASSAEGRFAVQYDYGTGIVSYIANGVVFATFNWGKYDDPLFFRAALASATPRINDLTFIAYAATGQPGASAPLVRVQWSINGVDNWHDNYFGADVYQRQSNDGGVTWGPAYRVVGENGTVGTDGTFASFVFKRSTTVPAAPLDNSGNPPTGWTDAPPAGTDFLWQSKATFRAATQLSSWSAPVRISGEDGFIVDTESVTFIVPVYASGATKPSWTGASGTIRLMKGGARQTEGVLYGLRAGVNLAGIALNGDTFSFAGITADTGSFIIQASYNGQLYERTITIKKVYDGANAFRGSATFNQTAGGGAVSLVATATAVPSSNGMRLSANANYTPLGGVVGSYRPRLHLYWENQTDNGGVQYLGYQDGTAATTVNQGTANEPDYVSTPGAVSAAFNFPGFPADKRIAFYVNIERIAGNISVQVTGAAQLDTF
ncbi:hypothetical protein KZ820_14415 [Sphingomonas sp. RRHST34]|uniref:Chitin-binding type-3 domain-containing protein n=1 Tax=Sphingomonas citri TaxID=2862499 RepID=A0ABS7BQP9_9SPHN|nr:hypothetical protein [Sphingomonas citri]MBW6531932.1 hypothetical protein [Sphingomonas citri]